MLDIKTWLIVGLLIIIALLILFQPSKPQINQELVRINDSLHREIKKGIEKSVILSEKRISDSLESTKSKRAYDSTLQKKNAQIAYYKAHPKVIEVKSEFPIIDSAFHSYDSAIAVRDDRIEELGAELTQSQELAKKAEDNFNEIIGSQGLRYDNLLEQMGETLKENRKLRRKEKLAKILIPVAAGLGIFLGAQF